MAKENSPEKLKNWTDKIIPSRTKVEATIEEYQIQVKRLFDLQVKEQRNLINILLQRIVELDKENKQLKLRIKYAKS